MAGGGHLAIMNDDAARERERFERIFREEYAAVLRYAAIRTDLDHAKDAAAQTFLVAWRRREELPEPSRAWLLGVTRRTLADLRRSGRRQQQLSSRLAAADAVGGDVHDGDGTASDREVVGLALAQVPDDDAEALRLMYWDELSSREAAELLGCSVTAFKVRVFRARSRFRRALQELDQGGQTTPTQPQGPGSARFTVPSSKEAS